MLLVHKLMRVMSILPTGQVDSDDVITRDEQIFVLIGAHAKCENSIQSQMALMQGLFVRCHFSFFEFLNASIVFLFVCDL